MPYYTTRCGVNLACRFLREDAAEGACEMPIGTLTWRVYRIDMRYGAEDCDELFFDRDQCDEFVVTDITGEERSFLAGNVARLMNRKFYD